MSCAYRSLSFIPLNLLAVLSLISGATDKYKEHDTEITRTCIPAVCSVNVFHLGFFLAQDSFLFLFPKKENY